MPIPSAPLTINLPPGFRTFVTAFSGGLGLFAVVLAAEALGHAVWIGALIAIALLAVLGVVAWRWASLAVTATNDGLVVRHFFGTRTILRGEIASFRTGGSRSEAPGLAVRAVLKTRESVVLGATGWYFRAPGEVRTTCAELESWLQGTMRR